MEDCIIVPAGGGSTSIIKNFQMGVDYDEDPAGLVDCFKLPESRLTSPKKPPN